MKTKNKKKQVIVVLKEAENNNLYSCDKEKLSEYFIERQINDYCVSTQGVMPS